MAGGANGFATVTYDTPVVALLYLGVRDVIKDPTREHRHGDCDVSRTLALEP